jgi:hypothetical protein
MSTLLLIPDPRLAQKAVQNILIQLGTILPWISHAYGLVQTGQRVVDKKTYLYPQLYRQDGSPYFLDLRPDQGMQAMAFFERNGPSTVEWDEGAMNIAGTWRHPVAMVVWCHLPAIDPRRRYDFSDELAADVLRALTSIGLDIETIEQRAEQVFARYRLQLADQQLLMYPFAGFRIPMVLTDRYSPCAAPFQRLPDPNTDA